MQLSIGELASSISETIEKLVIPELPRTSWASGYLHSALVLLANIEARADVEQGLLAKDSAALAALLREAQPLVAPPTQIRRKLDEVLAAARPDPATATPVDLERDNQRLAEALNALIVWTYKNRQDAASNCAPRLLELFRAYHQGLVERQLPIYAKAAGKPIF